MLKLFLGGMYPLKKRLVVRKLSAKIEQSQASGFTPHPSSLRSTPDRIRLRPPAVGDGLRDVPPHRAISTVDILIRPPTTWLCSTPYQMRLYPPYRRAANSRPPCRGNIAATPLIQPRAAPLCSATPAPPKSKAFWGGDSRQGKALFDDCPFLCTYPRLPAEGSCQRQLTDEG